MASHLTEYDGWADPDLYLRVRGRRIRIASPTAREGLRLRRLMLGDTLTPEQERVEVRRILGDAVDQIDAAGGDATLLALVGRAALLHFGVSPSAADAFLHGDAADKPEDDEPEDPSAPGYLGPDDPGGGPIDEATGLRRWFNPLEMAPSHGTRRGGPVVSWTDVLAAWDDVDLDMHDVYGVDLTSGVLDARPWRWLEVRLRDLASSPDTRLHRRLFPQQPPTK